MTQKVYFAEDQRWPSRSERFGWVVVIGVAIFIVFELKLFAFQPLAASGIVLVLLGVFLAVVTVQQRLSVKIGRNLNALPGQLVVQRFWQRARQAAHVEHEEQEASPDAPALRISYVSKSPLAILLPGRRGSRLGRRERLVPLDEIENWSSGRMPRFVWLRKGNPSVFPVGMQRDAVVIVLASGEKLTLPTHIPELLLEGLSAAKVDSVKRERVTPAVREEI